MTRPSFAPAIHLSVSGSMLSRRNRTDPSPNRQLAPPPGSARAYIRRPPLPPPLQAGPSPFGDGRLDRDPKAPAFGWARPASSMHRMVFHDPSATLAIVPGSQDSIPW